MAGYLDKVKQLNHDSAETLAKSSGKIVHDSGTEPTLACESLQPSMNCEISELSEKRLGDGTPPPLDWPPANEQELRQPIDHLADPQVFARWLEWAMANFDPAEQILAT